MARPRSDEIRPGLADLDLFRRFQDIEVVFTVATDDERVARLFEPGASPIAERIAALGRLREAGIRTMAFVGPILPADPARLASALEGNVDRVLVDRMNYIDRLRDFYARANLVWASTGNVFPRYEGALSRRARQAPDSQRAPVLRSAPPRPPGRARHP